LKSKSAQYDLAVSYEKGEGTEKDLEKAFYWYQKVAENGHDFAQNIYEKGEGTESI